MSLIWYIKVLIFLENVKIIKVIHHMARMKTIEISGLNIVSQPHSPKEYVEIFERIKESQPSFSVSGDMHLKLMHIEAIYGNDLTKGIKGKILRFSKIDSGSWVNTLKGSELTPDQTPEIPDHTSPNGIFFDFVFYPTHEINNHKLFYISKYYNSDKKKSCSLSPNLLRKFFEGILNQDNYFRKFDSIEVTVLPSRSALDDVLSLKTLKTLEILIKAPNPDDFAEIETRILNHMNETNVAQKFEKFTSDGDSIRLDEEMRNDARVASTNGYVKTKGNNDEDKIEERSTIDMPLREKTSVEADSPKAGLFALINYLFRDN